MKKRLLPLLLAVLLALSLTACGQSEAAKAADDLIAAIGEVTLDSEGALTDAEAAVAALSDEDRQQLKHADQLTEARAAYDALVLADAAAKVDEAIAALGGTPDADAVAEARALYTGSTAEVQAAVTKLADLEAAEAKLVSAQIDAIGEVTLENAAAIRAAQEAYDALTPGAAEKVANASVLEDAAAQLKTLEQEQAQALLAGMTLDEDRIRNLKFYYPKAWKFYSDGSWADDIRCFILPYIGQEGDRVWLRLTYNYTDDDWVFFKKVTIAPDDERYTRTFNYFDITRDNGGGDVWEYIDTEVSQDDIEMLWAIANSGETLVRFEGDDYSSDFTISASDKESIRDALIVYEALTN